MECCDKLRDMEVNLSGGWFQSTIAVGSVADARLSKAMTPKMLVVAINEKTMVIND